MDSKFEELKIVVIGEASSRVSVPGSLLFSLELISSVKHQVLSLQAENLMLLKANMPYLTIDMFTFNDIKTFFFNILLQFSKLSRNGGNN